MNNLDDPTTDVGKRGAVLIGHAIPSITGEQTVQSLVQEANDLFHDTGMPFEVCLALRDLVASGANESDRLASLVHNLHELPERIKRAELRALIAPDLLGGWALCASTIDYLIEQIEESRPSAILEFGSGTSSVALAWAMKRLYGTSSTPHLFSIDQSVWHIERTKRLLSQHGLADEVRFLHADLKLLSIGTRTTRCYGLSAHVLNPFFDGIQPDMVIVDGPAGENGVRFGTVPLVKDFVATNAAVFMDDGLRDSELDTADLWSRLGYVRWDGVRWEGKGLLVGRICGPQTDRIQQWLETAHAMMGPQHRSLRRQSTCRAIEGTSMEASPLIKQETRKRTSDSTPHPSLAPSSSRTSSTCVFLNTYYEAFLAQHYATHSSLASRPYHEQHASLQSACFGDSDFYSHGLAKAGWKAFDLIANCRPLQTSWAEEQGMDKDKSSLAIAVEQIRQLRPQVLYLQDLGVGTREFLTAIRPYVVLVVGQIASPVPPHTHLDGFDILISSFPHFVDAFRRRGYLSYYQPLAFDPRLLGRLGNYGREYPLTFVGGLSPAHRDRQEFLASLAKSLPVQFWGYGTHVLAQQGVPDERLHGDVWGRDMFSVLARSAITVNHHIDAAASNANNMRLFEATGCGALLVTDYKDNLTDLFDVGSEIVAYRSAGECIELLSYFLRHPREVESIAKRGQQRTLRDHTYERRMAHTAEILNRHLEMKIGANRLPDPDLNRISYGREMLEPGQITTELMQSWRSVGIPLKQRALVQRELQDMYRGNPPVVFRALADALRPYVRPQIPVLEVGCASGYYYEVLEYLLNTRLSYVGVDFSDAMIRLARLYYPQVRFEVGDGGALRFQDRSIPIVVSSGVLLHVREYAMHIAEAARVASEAVVFHRTPIARCSDTKHFKKFAYGVETFELRFNETELLALCRQEQLELITACEYDSHPERDEFETTYVFRPAA